MTNVGFISFSLLTVKGIVRLGKEWLPGMYFCLTAELCYILQIICALPV